MKKAAALLIAVSIALFPCNAAAVEVGNVPRIIVKYNSTVRMSPASLEVGVLEKRNIRSLQPGDIKEYKSMMESLSENPSVVYAEPVVKYSLAQTPSDPDLEYNWGHQATGAYQAWDISTGSAAVTVAVIDTGVDQTDPDLLANLVSGYDFVNRDSIPDNSDGATHATLVSKIIGAEAGNMVDGEYWGTAGMAWNCKIMPLKVFDENNPDASGCSDTVAEAVYYAVDHGVDIINMSLGGPEPCTVVEDAVRYAQENGILLVVSSGNSGDEVQYPAVYAEAMAVGAFGQNGYIEEYSCRGKEISVTAPGQILESRDESGQTYANGTSFSAPYVSGAAALIKSIHTSWTPAQIRWSIENFAEDAGDIGWDSIYGSGKLDIASAILEDSPPLLDGNDEESQRSALCIGENTGVLQLPLDVDYYSLILAETSTVKINEISPVPISLTDSFERWPAGEQIFKIEALYGRWSKEPYTISVEKVPYGDFDGSRRVDIYDLVRLAVKDGSYTGTGPGDSIWDGNLDGDLDTEDLNLAAAGFGETY